MILDDTNGGRLFDFFDNLLGGVDAGRHPQMLRHDQVARLINATVRGGSVVTRPGYNLLELTFDSVASKVWFEREAIQGAKYYSLNNGRIIASVGGHIFLVSPAAGTVKDITPLDKTTANQRNTPQAWLCQAEQYMIVQDGMNQPFIIEGAQARRAVPADSEVPVGSIMAYGQGRLVVANPQRTQFVVGDIVGGSTDVIKFTATQYLNEAPGFALPRFMGSITAMTFVAQQDTGTGTGGFLCFGARGCMAYDFSVPRTEWLNFDIAKAVLLHAGCTGPNALATVNGDVFYRSYDGTRSYRMARAEINAWGQTPMSREVRNYVDSDTPAWLQYCQAVNFDNRLLMTTAPVQAANGKGFVHLGLLALDFDLLRGMGDKANPAWEGVWTGLTPSALVEGIFDDEQRCFAFCSDADGINRIYEITRDAIYDVGSQPIPAVLETKHLTVESPYNLKQLLGADFWLSEIIGLTKFRLLWRPDEYADWTLWHEWEECASDKDCNSCVIGSLTPQQVPRRRMPAPPEACAADGSHQDLRFGYTFQFRIEWTGHAKIVKARFHFNPEVEIFQGACPGGDEVICRNMRVCPLDDFEYNISAEYGGCTDSVIAAASFTIPEGEVVKWDLRPYKFASVQGSTWEIYAPEDNVSYAHGPISNHRMSGLPDFIDVAHAGMVLRTWCANPFADADGNTYNPDEDGDGYVDL